MEKGKDKIRKKSAKAEIKKAKTEAKISTRTGGGEPNFLSAGQNLPDGVSISINKKGNHTNLLVTGLKEAQLKRLVPEVNKEIMITVTEDHSTFKAFLMRFVREGIFQTVIKILAGLVVGIVLLKIGLK